MSTLLLDIGNSRVKWARLEDDGLGTMHVVDRTGARSANWSQRVLAACGKVSAIVAVSVAGDAAQRALRQAARRRGLPPPRFVRSEASTAGIRNGYAQPWRLGADRWVAIIAAHHLACLPAGIRAVCVIDAGTALTIDIVDRRGWHRGGLIIPGSDLMVAALLDRTGGIRRRADAPAARPRNYFARSTGAALQQGTRQACAALADRAVERAAALLRERPLVLLTGGGAAALTPLLASAHRVVPDLVMEGLAVLVTAELC